MNIGYGQMDVQGNLNIYDHSSSYVTFMKKQILNIVGIFLKLVMEKESTMLQGRV